MQSMIVFIIVLSVLVIVHEFGHFWVAKRRGVRVERFSIGFGPILWKTVIGETEYAVSAIPLGGYVTLAGQDPGEDLKHEPGEFLSKSVRERLEVICAGPVLNYLFGFVVFWCIFIVGSPTITTKVGELLGDYPAKRSGVHVGDTVVAVDGIPVKYWEDMVGRISTKVDGKPITFTVSRDTERLSIDIVPTVKETTDIFGNRTRIALVGIIPSEDIETVRYGFLVSFRMAFQRVAKLTSVSYKSLWAIATGKMSMKDSMTGPIGIFVITGKVARLGFVHLLNLMAVLSISLAIFNLLPIPVLDGGHVVFLIIEKVMGRPLPAKAQEAITNLGLGALILLMMVVFYSDLARFDVFDKMSEWVNGNPAVRHMMQREAK